jgi:hypothetical protein
MTEPAAWITAQARGRGEDVFVQRRAAPAADHDLRVGERGPRLGGGEVVQDRGEVHVREPGEPFAGLRVEETVDEVAVHGEDGAGAGPLHGGVDGCWGGGQ